MIGKVIGAMNAGGNKTLLNVIITNDGTDFSKLINKLVELKEKRNKRSNTANGYMWMLIGKISERSGESIENIYIDAVKHVGWARVFHNLNDKDFNTLKTLWTRQGLAWPAMLLDYEPDGEHKALIGYYGSSTYDTKEMSRLIDYIVMEAKNLDIPTDTNKIKSLLDDWENHREVII